MAVLHLDSSVALLSLATLGTSSRNDTYGSPVPRYLFPLCYCFSLNATT